MTDPLPRLDQRLEALKFAQEILRSEAASLHEVAGRLDDGFVTVLEILESCRGRVAVTGVGKSADVGQKIVGTLNSTGTRAYLLDATRAMHGDLGSVHPDDVVLFLSHSGESDELLKLLPSLKDIASRLTAITSQAKSTLARRVDAAVIYGPITEACPLSLAPSTSTTVMLALGDALAFSLSERRQFTPEDFARYHPAGSLGRKLASVESIMRRGSELRIASASATVRQVFAQVRHTGRRTGAVMLVDADWRLAGLFTDSDLARLFESHKDGAFDQPIRDVMTKKPVTLSRTSKLGEAIDLLKARKISELPVVDEDGKPIGLLDITDIIGLPPEAPNDVASQ
ncbi:MAG: KpsF/GutQ family sugar-phosphate isomerase [Fimbriiglobus sp.]